MAQQKIVRSDATKICAACSICSLATPLCSTISSHETALQRRDKLFETARVVIDEIAIETPSLHRASTAFMIPFSNATSPLMRTCRNRSASSVPEPSSPSTCCGCLKRVMPDFRQRIDVDEFAAVSFGVFERRQHARMVCAGILTDDEDRLGLVEIFERDSSLPDADRFTQRRAARLVTHV